MKSLDQKKILHDSYGKAKKYLNIAAHKEIFFNHIENSIFFILNISQKAFQMHFLLDVI